MGAARETASRDGGWPYGWHVALGESVLPLVEHVRWGRLIGSAVWGAFFVLRRVAVCV